MKDVLIIAGLVTTAGCSQESAQVVNQATVAPVVIEKSAAVDYPQLAN